MKKNYIIPEIKSYSIDFQISMQMTSGSINNDPLATPTEAGNGDAGAGGTGNGSNDGSGWGRAQQYGDPNYYQNNINNYNLLKY